MNDPIRLLEDRVRRAAARLKQLAGERSELEAEIRTLQRRIDELERAAAREQASEDGDSPWLAERARVIAELKEAAAELRGE